MWITLQEFDSQALLSIEVSSNGDLANSLPTGTDKPAGRFARLGSSLVGLFQNSGRFYLFVDGLVLEAGDLTTVEHSDRGLSRAITICRGGRPLEIAYPKPRDPVDTPYYSEDPEDADFGLWLRNVLHSPERKRILAETWL
jgi:hypothetical protein